ncbi:MAG: leukotoxin LktA family filamentous adhesin [Acidaminococcaceae bacterium]|nr:leukotoxin LktA family filamentous adhesin [Acidaminococcaceae bacterium]
MTKYKSSQSFGGDKRREKNLLRKAVLTFLMTGVIAWPSFSPAYAAPLDGVVRSDGGVTKINGNVGDYYVGKQSGAVGVNVFDKFNVKQSEIANMQFHNQEKTYTATHLLNFVKDRINIEGTVNGIRNNRIGGNMYFISSNGMLVGEKGAINAGALTVMAPQERFISKAFTALDDGATNTATDVLKGMITGDIPLNPSGSIVINGTVRTGVESRFMAANIVVGKDLETNEKGEPVYNDDGTLKVSGDYQARIINGVDFSNIVNTKGIEGFAYALPADFDTDTAGKYRLKLKKEVVEETGEDGEKKKKDVYYLVDSHQGIRSDGTVTLQANLGIEKLSAETVTGSADIKTNIEVGKEAVIDSAGSVNITATADASPSGIDLPLVLAFLNAKANVGVNGTIKAGHNVDINANATSVGMHSGPSDFTEEIIMKVLTEGLDAFNPAYYAGYFIDAFKENLFPFLMNNPIAFVKATAKADVKVSGTAKVTATDDITVQGMSTVVGAAMRSVTPNTTYDVLGGQHPYENINFAMVNLDSMSNVDIEGDLNAGGTVQAMAISAANATTMPTIAANKHKVGESYSGYANAAVGIDIVKNNAKLTIGKDANIDAGTAAVLGAVTDTGGTNQIAMSTDQRAAFNTGVGYIQMDGNANTDIKGSVNSGGLVNIMANANVSSNVNSVNNASKLAEVLNYGTTEWRLPPEAFKILVPEDKQVNFLFLQELFKFMGQIGKNGADEPVIGAGNPPSRPNVFDKFDFGASVAITKVKNNAKVEVGKDAKVYAMGPDLQTTKDANKITPALTIAADASVAPISISTNSNMTDTARMEGQAVSAALSASVEDIVNNADVVIDARDGKTTAQKIDGKEPIYLPAADIYAPQGTVTINSTTLVGGYKPISWFNNLKDIFVGNKEKGIKSLPEQFKYFGIAIGDVFTHGKKVTQEFERVFGITAEGDWNVVNDTNYNTYDGSLYMDDVIARLQEVELKTGNGMSEMANEFKGDYQKSFNEAYDLLKSEKKFIDHDSRDYTTDGEAGKGGKVVDLAFKAPVQHNPADLIMTVLNLIVEIPKAFDPVGLGTNIAATAQSGKDADPDHNSLSFSGAATYFHSDSSANTVIGRNVQIEAGRADIGANEKQIAINVLTGKKSLAIFKIPTPYDTSGRFAIGGNVAVNSIENDAVVLVSEGAEIRTKNTTGDPSPYALPYHNATVLNSYQMGEDEKKGIVITTEDIINKYSRTHKSSGNVDVNSISNDVDIAAVLGGGKAMKLGLTGMAAVMKGHNYSYVGVDDEARLIAEKIITMQGINKSVLASAVVDLTKASGIGIGASVGVMDFGIDNLAMVADNDIQDASADGKTITLPSGEANPRKDREAADFIERLKMVLGADYAQAGRTGTTLTDGEIDADSLTLDAKTSGFRLNITLTGTETDARWENVQSSTVPEVGIAGSVSVNDFVSRTDAVLETPKLALHAPTATVDAGHLKINAADSGFIGAISGAAAVAFHITQSGDANPGGRLAGAVALNNITRNTVTEVWGTNIVNAVEVENFADSTGTQVAAGLSAGLSMEERSEQEIDASASVSKNKVNSTVKAVLKKVTTDNSRNAVVNNVAAARDIQVAGGLNLSAAGNDFACLGVTTALNNTTNTIEARVEEGTYDVKSFQNYANSQLKQVAGAVAVGLQLKGAGKITGQGAGATNTITNTVKSISQNANITANKVDMLAWDGVLSISSGNKNAYVDYLKKRGFDIEGEWALELANSTGGDVDMDVKDNPSGNQDDPPEVTYKTRKFTDGGKKGNTMVSFGVVAPIDVGSEGMIFKALGGGVTNNLTNTFDTTISGGSITAKASDGSNALSAQAKADSRLVAVAAGLAVSTGDPASAQAAGSVVVNNVKDRVGALVQNSTLKADKTYIYANDLTNIVSVAGALSAFKSGGKNKVSGGLTWAQGMLDNLTSAKMLGTNLARYNSGKKTDLTVNAVNNFTMHSIAAEVNADVEFVPDKGGWGVLRGAYAFNSGTNSTEALVDKTDTKASVIANGGNISVTTDDTSTEKAIAVAVGLSGSKVSGGVHIAKSYIGEEDVKKHQHNFAKIQNTAITLAGADSALKVGAKDNSNLTTIAVGGGYDKAAAFGLNGSVAKAKNYKDVEAAVALSTISVNNNLSAKKMEVRADNTMKMTTSADGASIGKESSIVGAAGVATNDSVMTTKAHVNGVTGGNNNAFKTEDMEVIALSDNTLTNVGISLATGLNIDPTTVTSFSLDALANVAKNKLQNDTTALVENSKVAVGKTATVKAKSEEKITNVVGAANVQVGTGATTNLSFGFGASVAVNTITGSTIAAVLNSDFKVGNGFYVNADAFHKNKNVVFSGGLAVNSSAKTNFSLAANAVVSDNEISGETKARLYKTDVNKGVTGSQAAVEVTAKDDIRLDSTTADVQLHVGVSPKFNVEIVLGAGVLVEDNNRSVKALAAGENGSNKSTINAKNFKVDANSTQTDNVVNACAGVSIAITPLALAQLAMGKPPINVSGAVSVATTHVNLKGITLAQVDHVNTDNQGMTVNAFKKDTVNATGVGAAGTFGLFGLATGVSVYKFTDDSKTISLLQNSVVTHNSGTVAADEITAKKESHLTSKEFAIAAGVNLGIASAVAVWNNTYNSSVLAKVDNTNIGTESKRGGNLKVVADTDVTEKFNSVSVGASVIAVGVNRVRNTLNTTTNAEVTGNNNKIYVNNAEVKANEVRNVTDKILQVVIGGLEVAVSDIVTNIGFVGGGTYVVTYSDKVTEATIDNANENLGENNSKTVNDKKLDAAYKAEEDSREILKDALNNNKFKNNKFYGDWSDMGPLGGLKQKTTDIPTSATFTSGVHTKVNGVNIDSAGSANFDTTTKNNITSTSGSYPMVAALGVDVLKNYVTLQQNNSVDITNAKIKAGNVFVGNAVEGEVNVHSEDARLIQGVTATVVKSSATGKGETKVNVENSDLIGLSGQVFRNLDTLKLGAEVISVGSSVLTGAYLKAETVDNSTMKMDIKSAGVGSSTLYSNGSITFENILAPQLESGISYGGGKIASGQGTLATAWLGNKSETSTDKTISMDVSDTSIFADNVQVVNGLSDNNGHQAKLTVNENVTSVSAALEIGVNKGRTTSVVNTSTNFSNIKSNASLANAYRTANGLTGVAGVADWHVFANNVLDIDNNLKNADVAIGICTGTNYTRNYTKNTTSLGFTVAKGTDLEAKALEIKANSAGNGTVHTRAYDGGIIEISPVAAGVKNEMSFNTSVSVGGNFVVAGKADIQSLHSSDLYLFADGHCGNIVGGSGIKVNNNITVNSTTNLDAANITTGDTLTVKANTMFDLNKKFNVDEGTPSDFMLYGSNRGGLAAGCGSYLTNVMNITNRTNVTNSTLHSKGNLVVGSYGDHHIYVTQSAVSSSFAVGGNNSVVKSTINETDEVNINQDSGKTTELLTLDNNADIYLVATDITDASAKGFSEHTFSLLFAGAGAHLQDTVNRNNKINVNGGKIFSYKDVNLFTNLDEKNVLGRLLLQESSRTFTSGAITIPYSNITSNLTQNNQVTIGSGAEVYSIGDVDIYADKGLETINRKNGSYCWYRNNLKDEFVTSSNGKTDSSVTRNNFVDVKGKVTAGILNNFEIYIGLKDQNPIIIVPDEATKSYLEGAGNTAAVYTADQYGQYISFGFVDDASGTVAEKEAALYRLTGINKEALKPELVDVAADADKRLNEIQTLLGEYSFDGQNSAVYKALKAEEKRLINEMERRGLAGGAPGGAQRVSQNMRFKIPNITVGGGNVHIETDTLKGDGTITANGMQEVKITNNTSALLEVHDVYVGHLGGQITFNKNVLPKDNYRAEIKKLNVDKSVGESNIPTLVTQANGVPTITIRGLWTGANVKYKSFTIEGQTMPAGSLILPADVYILGTVENLSGNVFVESAHNDIVINSNDGSGIRGANITLKAEQGGIVQLAPGSTINIGQTPHIAYDKEYNELVAAYRTPAGRKVLAALMGEGDSVGDYLTDTKYKATITGEEAYALGIVGEDDKDANTVGVDFSYAGHPVVYITKGKEVKKQWDGVRVTLNRTSDKTQRNVVLKMNNCPTIIRNDGDRVTDKSAGYIAGDRVFIQGRDININGIIQSGYGEYRLNLTAADENAINSIKNRYQGGDLTDAQVLNNSAYRIREGGAAWDSATQSYRYEMAAYYNPATDTVVVPSVNSRGGDIYLSGRIVSTGNGLIKCLDGVSNININNTYNHNLAVSDLTVSEVKGKVTISDDGLMRNVSIYRNKVESGRYEGNASATNHVSGGNGSFSYQPLSGLAYEWVSGESEQTIKTYEGKKRATWWGWSKYKDYDIAKLIDEAEDKHVVKDEPVKARARTPGNYITQEATSQSEFMQISRSYTGHTVGARTQSGPPTYYATGLYGCHKWMVFQWTEKNGYAYTNEAKVKADYPIKIDFIGATADNGVININNIGNVAQDKIISINGNVGNTQLYGTGDEKGRVNIQSNGAIKQVSGNIYGRTVDLSAKGNIENIKITAGNIVNLDAWSTAAGSSVKVDVTAQGNALGNINLGAFGGGINGTYVALANLTAQGDILCADRAVNGNHNYGYSLVNADRIDLVSTNGGIGKAGKVLCINGGQVADTNNSMSASVNADAKNSIYMMQTIGTLRVGKIVSHEGDLVIEVPGGGIVDAQMFVESPDAEKTIKKDLISEWASIGLIDDGSVTAKEQIAMKNEQLARERYVLEWEREQKGTTPERKAEIDRQLAEIPKEYTPWNADQLLYALQASIFNPEADVNASPKDPNLYGKSITLKVANNVGILSDDVKKISTVGLYDRDKRGNFIHLDDIRAISWADPGTTKYDKDKKEITIVNKIAIGVQHQNGGSLTVTNSSNGNVANHVFLEGRDVHSNDVQFRDIKVGEIKANGEVRLTSLGNLFTDYSAPEYGPAIVTKGNLFLSVGDAADNNGFSIGSNAMPFLVQADGSVQLLATGDIYLKSLVNLNLLDVVAGRKGNENGGNIYLQAVEAAGDTNGAYSGNIYGVYVGGQDIQGNIRSDGNKSITLKADGSIGFWGDEAKTVRIKNVDSATDNNKLTLSAGTNIVVEGVSTAPVTGEKQAAQGVFCVQKIQDLSENGRKLISITVNGTLLMAEDLILNHNNPETVIALKADKLKFAGGYINANTISLQSVTSLEEGKESAIVGKNVNLVAGVELDKFTYGTTMLVDPKDLANSRVAQEDEAILRAYNLNVISNADIDLESRDNKIFNIVADAQKTIQIASGSLRGAVLGYDENAGITAVVKNSHDPE